MNNKKSLSTSGDVGRPEGSTPLISTSAITMENVDEIGGQGLLALDPRVDGAESESPTTITT